MNRRNRLRRAALVLALLVLAAIVTGVAQSAATTAVPKLLTGTWEGPSGPGLLVIGPRGKLKIRAKFRAGRWYRARFSHITAHKKYGLDPGVGRLTISRMRSCSGIGTYRWTITNYGSLSSGSTYVLKFMKIHDSCKPRAKLLTPPGDRWVRHASQQP